MTTYNTGNPVPSADARDRYDNSQTLDEVVNGDSESYTSRTGKQVISLGGMNSRFNNAQEARESAFNLSQEAFQSFLEGSGWSSIGAYGAGLAITSHTQTVDYLGQPYSLKPSIPASLDSPYITTGVWATEGVNFKLVGDNSLRQDLAGDDGGDLIFNLEPLTGAVRRSLTQYQGDTISASRFGPEPNGKYRPLSEFYPDLSSAQFHYATVPITSLLQSIDWAVLYAAIVASKGRRLQVNSGQYVVTGKLPSYSGMIIEGDGGTMPFYQNFPMVSVAYSGGVDIIAYGIGPKDTEAYGITDMQPSGGVRQDPTTGLDYALTNFHNSDATATTPATKRAFSCIFDLTSVNSVQLRNLRIVPRNENENGILGRYNDPSYLGWADDWDIGVLMNDAHDNILENVRCVGHWRMSGLAMLAGLKKDENGLNSSSERNKIIGGQYTGKVGVLMRGADVYAVTAVSSSSISIPWHDSNPFPAANGEFLVNFGGATATTYAYTSSTKVGDKVVFSGVTPDPTGRGVTTNSSLFPGGSFGFQGTEIRGAYISSLEHPSGRRCTDPALLEPFATPGKCIEVTGVPAASLRLFGNTIMTAEDCFFHSHNASNFYWFGNYWESKSAVGISGKGARFIGCGSTAKMTWAPYPRGVVHTFWLYGDTLVDQADLSPAFKRPATISRFGADGGMFDVTNIYSSEHQTNIAENNAYVINGRLNESVRIEDGNGAMLALFQNIGNWTMGKRARFNTATEDRYQFYRLDGSTVILSLDGTLTTPVVTIDGNFVPLVANTRLVGTATKPFSGGNVQTAFNITSDRDYKTDITAIPDVVLDAWATVGYSQFLLLDSVAAKGEAARTHTGTIAQEIEDAFERAGIDPFKYGVLCHDEWKEKPEIIGEDGCVEQEYQAAGQRYSVRYEEAYALESALMRRTTERLEYRIAALEKLNA